MRVVFSVVEFVSVVEGIVVEVKAETTEGVRLEVVGALTVEMVTGVELATVEATGSTGSTLLTCCSTCRDRRVFKGTSLSLSLVEEAAVVLVDVVVTVVVNKEGVEENDMV